MRDKELRAEIEAVELVSVQDLFTRPLPLSGGKVGAGQAKSGSLAAVISILNLLPNLSGNIRAWPVQKGSPGKMPDRVQAEILLELKRFLDLLTQSGEPLVPSQYVAMALAETVEIYGKDVLEPVGLGAIHLSPPQAQFWLAEAFAHTTSLRGREFGEADPEHVWPKALAIKLQLTGWIALTQGIATAIMSKLGVVPILWAVPGLILGGFL